jgi:murein DD-endopeptidase MepM/ murein hydrolase activator NlpD
LTVRTARVITYSFVGLFAFFALRMTPPIAPTPDRGLFAAFTEQRAGAPAPALAAVTAPSVSSASTQHAAPTETLAPIMMRPIVVRPAGFEVSPVVVVASNVSKVDTLTVSGVIHSNLFTALDHSRAIDLPRAARAELAFSLADIFEYRVDMSKDLQDGDKFHILVERLQKPNGAIIISRILGAQLALSGNEIEAILFKSSGASGDYFDATGKSLRAAFLRAPVAFRRISSIFGGRRHPVLGIWRQHKGTDYSAAMGTPVRSIGDGVVIFVGRKGGYGNMIDIRHRNGFVSRYGHLRGFALGVRRGARVSIGSTIGYVGMTGLATGPHLHFEVLVGGVQRDPRVALRMKGGQPIASSERGLFNRMRSKTLASFGSAEASTN